MRLPLPRPLVPGLAALLCLAVLLPAACILPSAEPPAEPTEAAPAAEATAEPTAEPGPPVVRSLPAAANVRSGPGMAHPSLFHVPAGAELTVLGRNADGTWLQIGFGDRTGWILGSLTDIDADALAGLPETAPPVAEAPAPATPAPEEPPAATPVPEPAAEPAGEPDPTPAPTPAPAVDNTVRVIGNPVNLRLGPGTQYAVAGQVRAGDRLRATGRNADGTWLQVEAPGDPEGRLWIYTSLTGVHPAAARVRFAEARGPASTAPVPAVEAPQPQPQPQPQAPAADCARRHTVNPNETRLVQITDWYGLDLAAVAALNGLDPDAPLAAGTELCLPDAAAPQPAPATPAPAPQPPAAGGACRSAWGNPFPCPDIPNHPERAVKSVEGVPLIWRPPGSYGRDLPGLDHDFELVLGDDSTLWNWRMRDPAACYDALRVHMGDIPREIGLQRLEVRLTDPVDMEGSGLVDMEFSESISFPDVDWGPVIDGASDNFGDLHPDLGNVLLRCYDRPQGRPDNDVFCRIFPVWGNSGSINLEAAVTLLLADTAGQMSRQAVARQYGFTNRIRLEYNAYLIPIIDDGSGDPAGSGPCMEVTRGG